MFRKVVFEVFFFKILRAKTRAEVTFFDHGSLSHQFPSPYPPPPHKNG